MNSMSHPRLLSTAILHLFIFLARSLASMLGLKVAMSSILLPSSHTPAVTPAATAAPSAVTFKGNSTFCLMLIMIHLLDAWLVHLHTQEIALELKQELTLRHAAIHEDPGGRGVGVSSHGLHDLTDLDQSQLSITSH